MMVDGGQVIGDLMWLLPNMRKQVNCPHCYTCRGDISSVIIHLNDHEHWTREQIADWLETLDVDLTFPTEPPPRPEPAFPPVPPPPPPPPSGHYSLGKKSAQPAKYHFSFDPAPISKSVSWATSDTLMFQQSEHDGNWILVGSLSQIQFQAISDTVADLTNGFKKFAAGVLQVCSVLAGPTPSFSIEDEYTDWLKNVPADTAIDAKRPPKVPVVDKFRFKNGDLPLDLSTDAMLAKTQLTVSTVFPDGLTVPIDPKFLAAASYPKPKEKRNARHYGP